MFSDRHIAYPKDDQLSNIGIAVYRAVKESGLVNPTGIWEQNYALWHKEYTPALEAGDTKRVSELLQNFFRNDLRTGIVSHSTLIGNKQEPELVAAIERDLRVCYSSSRYSLTSKDFDCPWVGNPVGLQQGDGAFILPDAPRHFSHATTIVRLTGDLESPVILEIGGGYGGVAHYLVRLMNRRRFKYIIVDFTPVLIIAAYFLHNSLSSIGEGHVPILLIHPEAEESVGSLGNGIYLVPIEGIDNIRQPIDLFYNANSFSEMPRDEIGKYMQAISRLAPRHLFLEANAWTASKGDIGLVPLNDFPIPPEYTLESWNVAPWAAGVGRLKEAIYVRRNGK